MDEVQSAPQLTFLADGHLFAISDAAAVTCLSPVPNSTSLVWAPTVDRVAIAGGRVIGPEGAVRGPLPGLVGVPEWTRPTGRSLLYRNTEGGLTKAATDATTTSPLSPLQTHDAVAYHPDGFTFAVSGQRDDTYGLWISRNDGTDPQLLASGVDVLIDEIQFSADAAWLFFQAHHDGQSHIHSVSLEPFEIEGGAFAVATRSEDSGVDLVGATDVADMTLDPADPFRVAFSEGACGARYPMLSTWTETADPTVIPLSSTPGRPVGFLPAARGEARIAIAGSTDGCDGPWQLSIASVDIASGEVTTAPLLDQPVQAAAVRAAAPEPAFTLAGVVIEPFA